MKFELTATGPEPRFHWRTPIVSGKLYRLGRQADCELVVPWDGYLSREHVELEIRENRLFVKQLSTGKTPLFHKGEPLTEVTLSPGEQFVIGETCFQLLSPRPIWISPNSPPVDEVSFSRQALEVVRFRDAEKRIEVLTHLPEVIWGARTDEELFSRLMGLLLRGIPEAESAALVSWNSGEMKVLHWERRRETSGMIQPSTKLVRQAIEITQQSVLHVWEHAAAHTEFTAAHDCDWAFCTPVRGSGTPGWGLYLAGQRSNPLRGSDQTLAGGLKLEPDIKFAELVAEIISSARKLQKLERQQSGLRQFFAPAVLSIMGDNFESGLLSPREAEVTILFCDLRGFSRQAEASRQDLLGLLDRVSQALGIMTRHILEHGGGIGDFLGDAALGFWGWPVSSSDGPLDACRAALAIREEFEALQQQPDHPLANFQVGVGVAHGRAVAGKIGTSDLVKITVFGPVVNLASRLEGMTRQLRVPVLLDEMVAAEARKRLPPEVGRLRRLARLMPYGMETPLDVSELVPPADQCPLTDEHLRLHEEAVELFIKGKWEEAYTRLHALPASDHAQDFLAVMIAQHNRQPPSGWDGIVRLTSK